MYYGSQAGQSIPKDGLLFVSGVTRTTEASSNDDPPPTPPPPVTYYWDNNGATAGFGTASGVWGEPPPACHPGLEHQLRRDGPAARRFHQRHRPGLFRHRHQRPRRGHHHGFRHRGCCQHHLRFAVRQHHAQWRRNPDVRQPHHHRRRRNPYDPLRAFRRQHPHHRRHRHPRPHRCQTPSPDRWSSATTAED
jgi:hypothetical protein